MTSGTRTYSEVRVPFSIRFLALIVDANEEALTIDGISIGKKMKSLKRITFNPAVMGGRPCIRDLRVTVGTLVGLLAVGNTPDQVISLYPYLEPEDINEALSYAAWRSEEVELPLQSA